MTLRKNKSDNKILFVDASAEFVRQGIKNKLSDDNIERIVDVVRYKKDDEHFSRYVDVSEVVKREYNLSVNTYIETKDLSEVIDIKELNASINQIVKRVDELRKSIDEIVSDLEGDVL